jgi:uncharacterized membrane protein
MFPPIPAWDGLHPLVIHFPIALLMVAPLLVLFGLIRGNTSSGLSLAALGLMVLGTISAWVAVSTGESAGELAERLPGVEVVLERHEELAELTRSLFTVLTGIFAVIVVLPMVLKRELPFAANLALNGAFLLLYTGSMVVLVNTAHEGGRLVHEFGVRAMMDPSPPGQGWLGEPEHDDD